MIVLASSLTDEKLHLPYPSLPPLGSPKIKECRPSFACGRLNAYARVGSYSWIRRGASGFPVLSRGALEFPYFSCQ